MATKPLLNRAKYVDEPYVRHRLENVFPNNKYSLGAIESDWEHADIDMIAKDGSAWKIDVKRSLPKYVDSPNFTFVCKRKGKDYPLNDNGIIAFIDDKTGDIYLVSHIAIRRFMSELNINKNIKDIEYILISKDMLKRQQNVHIIQGNWYCSQYLLRNADPLLFNF